MDSLPGIFYFFDDRLKFIRWNKNFEKMSGYFAHEFASISPLDFFASQDRDLIQQKIRDVFSEGEATAEADLVAKDGDVRRFFLTGKLLTFDHERYVLGTGIDISKRHQAEIALRREKAFSDAIIDSLPGNFYLLSEHGKAVRWNRLHEQATGYSPEEIAGMNTLYYFQEEDRELVTRAVQRVFSEGEKAAVSIDPPYIIAVQEPVSGVVAGLKSPLTCRRTLRLSQNSMERAFSPSFPGLPAILGFRPRLV